MTLEIQKIATDKIAELEANGELKKVIENRVEQTLKDVIDYELREYGDFGVSLKNAVKQSLQNVRVTLPEYNLYVAEVVQRKFQEVLKSDLTNNLEALLTEVIPTVEATVNMSTIFARLEKEFKYGLLENNIDTIEIRSEESNSGVFRHLQVDVSFSEDHDESVMLNFISYKNEPWTISSIHESGRVISHPKNLLGHMSELAKFFFPYYAMRTQFNFDCEIDDIYFGYD